MAECLEDLARLLVVVDRLRAVATGLEAPCSLEVCASARVGFSGVVMLLRAAQQIASSLVLPLSHGLIDATQRIAVEHLATKRALAPLTGGILAIPLHGEEDAAKEGEHRHDDEDDDE